MKTEKRKNRKTTKTQKSGAVPALPIGGDKDWQARDDAHILIRAREVEMDKARHTKAVKVAAELAEERRKEVMAAAQVAATKSPTGEKKGRGFPKLVSKPAF